LDSLRLGFGEPELLSVAEGNGWRPEKGADKVDAHKGSALVAKGLPCILQFHLKRFNYDWQTDTTTKLNKRFSFPKTLDLATLCNDIVEGEKSLVTYELQAIVVHMGEYGVGHYYAYVLPDIEGDKWYRFNDDIVQEVSFDEVTADAFGGRVQIYEDSLTGSTKSKGGGVLKRVRRFFNRSGGSGVGPYGWGGERSNAYVLQYVRKVDIPLLYHPKEV
jgi:ubiquitin carboxyl-terminal hydrolase 7